MSHRPELYQQDSTANVVQDYKARKEAVALKVKCNIYDSCSHPTAYEAVAQNTEVPHGWA